MKEPGYLDDLAARLEAKGFDRSLGTADVFQMPDGSLRMANGNHRAETLCRLNQEKIPARIIKWEKVPKNVQDWFRQRFPLPKWF